MWAAVGEGTFLFSGQALRCLPHKQLSLVFMPPNLPLPVFETARGPFPPVGVSSCGKFLPPADPLGLTQPLEGSLGGFR